MLRSLFSGISGLRANQTALDVTGNNIANANTIGFKGSRTLFQDTLSQTINNGAAVPLDANGEAIQGGTNPSQIGLGVQVNAVQTLMGQGSAQLTSQPLDAMIQGDGFFVVRRGTEDFFTRVGAFNFDREGNLTLPNGMIARGFADDGTGVPDTANLQDISLFNAGLVPEDIVSVALTPTGAVTANLADGTQTIVGHLALADFPNPAGLSKAGETMFRPAPNSGDPLFETPGNNGKGTLLSGALEMSNVDLAAEFTNLIIAQRGFQASSRVITTSDQVLEELVNIKR